MTQEQNKKLDPIETTPKQRWLYLLLNFSYFRFLLLPSCKYLEFFRARSFTTCTIIDPTHNFTCQTWTNSRTDTNMNPAGTGDSGGWLTPPTRSKCSMSCRKSMSWPLKAQEKEASSAGSQATWQGSTTLSPTMISVLVGLTVILLGSDRRSGRTDRANAC